MYQFITEDRTDAGAADPGVKTPPSIQDYCHALGVSISGYRKHCRQQSVVSPREIAEAMLDAVIRKIHTHHKGRYGYARITAELKRRGHSIDRKRVLKRMQAMNLHARSHRPFKKTTSRDKRHIASPNLLKQRFLQDLIRTYFVTDVTYIDTDEGFVFLSIVIDLATREVVGWSISETLEQSGIVRAIERMIIDSRPAPGAMLHSDRGSQYTASVTRELLKAHGIIQSMSDTGNCYDNAVAESYFKTIKNEEIYWKHYRTRDEVRTSIVDYIDYYNNERLHSTIGLITPRECRELKLRNQQSITNHPIEATLLKG